MPESLISASAWPVFDKYELFRNFAGDVCVGPVDGACIACRVDLTDPRQQTDALKAAMKLTAQPRRRGRPRKEETVLEGRCDDPRVLRDGMTSEFWERARRSSEESVTGTPRSAQPVLQPYTSVQDDVLEYVSRYGVLGLGPSRIVRAQQRLARHPWWLTTVVRSAGRLIETGNTPPNEGQSSSVELEVLRNSRPPWDPFYCRADITVNEAFSHQIGSDQWWASYVEPLWEIPDALGDLLFAETLEPRLADTFVDLSGCAGMVGIGRSSIRWRSVSAIGALSLAVLNGGLLGWEICPYCREPFEPDRKGQRFCTKIHQQNNWARENARSKRNSNG